MPDQLDIYGGASRLNDAPSPDHEVMALFAAPTTMKGQTAMSTNTATLHYDGAPRAITEDEAERIAEYEYDSRGCMMLSGGADGGMHWRGDAYSPGAARGWAEEKRRAMVRRIMAGECAHTVFYDRVRDSFYCG